MEGKTDDELKAMIDEALRELGRRIIERRHETLKQIKQLAEEAGFKVKFEELVEGGGKKLVPVKYRNPSRHEETWTGRGKHPKWLQRELDNGHSVDEFRIG